MPIEISECQDGYYNQGTQCVRCRSNCAPNTSCNKDTGKCDGKHSFVCVMGRKSAIGSGGNNEEMSSGGVSPSRHLVQYLP